MTLKPPAWLSARRYSSVTRAWDQQVWLWGRDILRPQGNLLIDFGAQRLPRPQGAQGNSLYRLEWHGVRIALWGFGCHYGVPGLGGAYLGRFQWAPRLTESGGVPDLWEPKDLPACQEPRSKAKQRLADELLQGVAAFAREYEAFVLARAGKAYRQAILEEREARFRSHVAEPLQFWRSYGQRSTSRIKQAA